MEFSCAEYVGKRSKVMSVKWSVAVFHCSLLKTLPCSTADDSSGRWHERSVVSIVISGVVLFWCCGIGGWWGTCGVDTRVAIVLSVPSSSMLLLCPAGHRRRSTKQFAVDVFLVRSKRCWVCALVVVLEGSWQTTRAKSSESTVEQLKLRDSDAGVYHVLSMLANCEQCHPCDEGTPLPEVFGLRFRCWHPAVTSDISGVNAHVGLSAVIDRMLDSLLEHFGLTSAFGETAVACIIAVITPLCLLRKSGAVDPPGNNNTGSFLVDWSSRHDAPHGLFSLRRRLATSRSFGTPSRSFVYLRLEFVYCS